MKIVILGGAGFLGSAIANFYHQKGLDIYCVDNQDITSLFPPNYIAEGYLTSRLRYSFFFLMPSKLY